MTSRSGHSALPTAFALPAGDFNIVFIARDVHFGQRDEQAINSSGSEALHISRGYVWVSESLFVTHPI
mgnify:CR=1 FL=1